MKLKRLRTPSAIRYRSIRLSAVLPPEGEPDFSLTHSVRRWGLLQPLLLCRQGGSYRLLAGRRRYWGAQAAGMTRVRAAVISGSAAELRLIALAEENHRELHFLERGAHLAAAEEKGIPRSALVRWLGESEEHIRDLVALQRLSEEEKSELSDLSYTKAVQRLQDRPPLTPLPFPKKVRQGALLTRPVFETLERMRANGVCWDLKSRESGEAVELTICLYKKDLFAPSHGQTARP